MASERKNIISRVSASTQTDALKGYAVINQQKFFDSIIDSRIRVQKALTNSNLLPLNNETFEEFKSEKTDAKLQNVEKSVHALLDSILSLRAKLFTKEKVTKEPLKYKPGKKRSFNAYLEQSAKYDDILNKNRDLVLTKWSHKVQSASGASALNASKFKTINQSAEQQVESNLVDMDRLVKRTRLNRRNIKPIGLSEEEHGDGEDIVKVDRSLQEDENVFDDEDFYRVLLNDLVDKKISDSNPVNGLTIKLTKTKVKKNVDTKASKGRKLKFTVQEQIQNWEAPNGNFKWSDEQIDEFFAGLFGQKINFNEEEVEGQSDDDNEDEEQGLLKNDDLKIFG
jgi:protein AATF/BFR2